MRGKDLRGQQFGRLTCLEPTDQRGPSGGVVWRCRCQCGRECLAVSTDLIHGGKSSCGCLRHPPPRDLTGRRFGSLVVTQYAGRSGQQHLWRCRCDCGRETVARQSNLTSGHTKSCGCLQQSAQRDNMRRTDGTALALIENRDKGPIRSNTSGWRGVYLNRKSGMWTAQITFQGKTRYLGSFSNIRDAIQARKKGEAIFDEFLEQYYADHADQDE